MAQPKPLPTWRQMNMDTSPEVEQIQFAQLRKVPPWRKVEMLIGLNEMALDLAYCGLERRHPDVSEADLNRYLVDMLLGAELANRVYGEMSS